MYLGQVSREYKRLLFGNYDYSKSGRGVVSYSECIRSIEDSVKFLHVYTTLLSIYSECNTSDYKTRLDFVQFLFVVRPCMFPDPLLRIDTFSCINSMTILGHAGLNSNQHSFFVD